MNEGRKLLQNMVDGLDNPETQEPKKPEIKKPNLPKVKHYFKVDVKDCKQGTRIIEGGQVDLYTSPLMIMAKNKDLYKSEYLHLLLEAETLKTQCLIYGFEYKIHVHELLINCENCINAYKTNNRFCQLMAQAVRVAGLGLAPYIYNDKGHETQTTNKTEV